MVHLIKPAPTKQTWCEMPNDNLINEVFTIDIDACTCIECIDALHRGLPDNERDIDTNTWVSEHAEKREGKKYYVKIKHGKHKIKLSANKMRYIKEFLESVIVFK